MGSKNIFKTHWNTVVLSVMCVLSMTVLLSSLSFRITIVDSHCTIITLQQFLDCGKQNFAGGEHSLRHRG